MYDDFSSDYIGTDVFEAAKMAPFTPRVQGGDDAPWWQGIVQYGLVKAIDNTLPGRAPGIAGNTQPGSFAGQNGATYSQTGPAARPPAPASGGFMSSSFMGIPTIALLAIGLGVAGFIAFKR